MGLAVAMGPAIAAVSNTLLATIKLDIILLLYLFNHYNTVQVIQELTLASLDK